MSFSRTLVKGLELFKKAAAAAKGGQLAGKDAFLLWDTFGFPLDLTQALCGPRRYSTTCLRILHPYPGTYLPFRLISYKICLSSWVSGRACQVCNSAAAVCKHQAWNIHRAPVRSNARSLRS